jgi:hypothetical protein
MQECDGVAWGGGGLIFKVPAASSPKASQTGWNRSYQELFWSGCVPALLQTRFEQIIVKLNSPPPTPAKKSLFMNLVKDSVQLQHKPTTRSTHTNNPTFYLLQ